MKLLRNISAEKEREREEIFVRMKDSFLSNICIKETYFHLLGNEFNYYT